MASKYQREHDMYVARGNTDRAAQVVAAAKAEGDPVAEPAKADKPARKPARKRGGQDPEPDPPVRGDLTRG